MSARVIRSLVEANTDRACAAAAEAPSRSKVEDVENCAENSVRGIFYSKEEACVS